MQDDIDPHLLERFLAGDCTDAERERVVRWVDGIPKRQALIHALRMAWTHLDARSRHYDSASAWESVAAKLDSAGSDAGLPNAPERRLPPPRSAMAARESRPKLRAMRASAPPSPWRVAAAALVMVGVASTGVWWLSSRATHRLATKAAPREVSTPRGQRATIRLADGSVVTLAPASRLLESANFSVETRDVWLDGEAYFEVAHDATKPFRVHTRRGIARDLGTSFLVQAYSGSPEVQVVVADGLVSLRRASNSPSPATSTGAAEASDSLLLRPRELGSIDSEGRLTMRSGVALDDYTAWTSGRLVFTGTPLREAIPRLSRWYDVEIKLGDADLEHETFTATLTHEPISEIVRLLAATVQARVEQRGDTLILFRRRVPR
jgi:transmembrane sensor